MDKWTGIHTFYPGDTNREGTTNNGFRRNFKVFFHYKSMEKLDPQGGASLHPSDLSGFTYEEGHQTLLH